MYHRFIWCHFFFNTENTALILYLQKTAWDKSVNISIYFHSSIYLSLLLAIMELSRLSFTMDLVTLLKHNINEQLLFYRFSLCLQGLFVFPRHLHRGVTVWDLKCTGFIGRSYVIRFEDGKKKKWHLCPKTTDISYAVNAEHMFWWIKATNGSNAIDHRWTVLSSIAISSFHMGRI